jgi:neutral ceramidase
MTILTAGVARKVITPPPGISLMGYGNRIQGNIGVHDDLYVTTLVLDDGVTRAAILTADHTFINTRIVDKIKNRLQDEVNIAPDGVFICCSHTHAAPIGYADENSGEEDRAYIQYLMNQLVDSAIEAWQSAQPVSLRAGKSEANININRRERVADGSIIIGNNPAGVVDHSVQVVQVVAEQNKVVATLVNYACHPVVMGPLNRLASADWVGAMRGRVESSIPGLCLFIQGTTADINPRKMRWTDDNWDEVEEQGQAVGDAVLTACNQLETLNITPIQANQTTEWLKVKPTSGYPAQIRAFIPDAKSDGEIRAAIKQGFPWHTELDERADGVYSAMNGGLLRIGDWALATLETEPFTETGLTIKAASPAKVTFVAGYTNGCNSYLPVQSAYADGGYEVETAPLFYGLPAPFEAGGAEQMTEAIIKLFQS